MRAKRFAILALVISTTFLFAQSPGLASLKAKAQSGDAAAQLALGRAYERGENLPRNFEAAAKWYRAAAEQGSPEAQSDLGVMYRLGRGVEEDKEEAVRWYRKAANQGFGPAMFNLATCYYNGDGVGISDRLAYAWFVVAKRAGSAEAAEAVTRMEAELEPAKLLFAKTTLAEMVKKGTDLPKPDPAFAFEIYKGIIDSNTDTPLTDARFEVGRMYAEGIGVAVDGAKALSYFEASKTPQSLRYVARMYMEGKVVPANPEKAVAALNRLVEMGDGTARKQLAGYYWDGGPVRQDYKQAIKFYTILANQNGDPLAFYRLGVASRDGLGVKKSVDDACFYFVLAHNVGSPDASKAGQQSCEGNTLIKAKSRAVKWAEQNRAVIRAAQHREETLKSQQTTTSAK